MDPIGGLDVLWTELCYLWLAVLLLLLNFPVVSDAWQVLPPRLANGLSLPFLDYSSYSETPIIGTIAYGGALGQKRLIQRMAHGLFRVQGLVRVPKTLSPKPLEP